MVALSARCNTAGFDGYVIQFSRNVQIKSVLMHFDSRIDLWCMFAVPRPKSADAGDKGMLVSGLV